MKKNEHLNLEIYLRRGHHPYMSSTYINGYVKDQPLRNMGQEEIEDEFVKFNKSFGRKALKHNSIKVMTSNKSIQGGWRNDLWQTYPQHMLETQREIPYINVEKEVPLEYLEKKRRPHINTTYLRKKFPIPQYNKNF